MTQPESSLTLDAVICGRCHAISPADEHTCPYCGADRHGAVFTSVADAAAISPVEEPYDIVDLRDTGWLTRLARRKMVTSYPSLVEPGDELAAPVRTPARKILAVLVGGVVAAAAGAYFYAQQAAVIVPTKSGATAGVAGDGALLAAQGRGDAGRPTLARHGSDASSDDARDDNQARTSVATPGASAAATATEGAQASQGDTATGRVVSQTRSLAVVPATSAHARTFASASAVVAGQSAIPQQRDKTPVIGTAASPTMTATAPRPPSQTTVADVATATASGISAPAAVPVTRAAPTASAQSAPAASAHAASVPMGLASSDPAQAKASPTPILSPQPKAATTTPTTATVATDKSPPSSATATATARPNGNPPQASTSVAQPERPTPAAVARSIVAVRQALAAHDLSAARRHLRGLYANQALSPEIAQLAADVSRQERARDSAIASARACSAKQEPACAVRNARRAVALDPRNPQAQTLLRQAMAAQAEANTAYFRQASALPAPVPAAMTFDGRWSAAGRHGATASQQDRSPSTFTIFGLGVPTVAKGRGDAH
ncbi:hypothetical protein [Caballeronia sp. BCC1704]|uniref:hypothetical protein n=1 Tax=Caballeronia sp. BCC1704 TaxID=2676300 RepID=UPI0015888D98|nr:hypothetical protein [Caballeronia sp. BCC1704]